jgi:hypothetical protein
MQRMAFSLVLFDDRVKVIGARQRLRPGDCDSGPIAMGGRAVETGPFGVGRFRDCRIGPARAILGLDAVSHRAANST